MASTSSTTYASTIRTKHILELLKTASGYLVAPRFAVNQKVSKGEGDTVRVNRILRPSKVTSASSSGTLIAPASAKALTSNFKDMSMQNWGDSFAFNEDVDVTSWISQAENRDVVANQMARSLDYQTMKTLATEGLRWRIDKDSDYQKSGTCTGTPTTTALISTGLDEGTDEVWAGGDVTITNSGGPSYDISSAISAFTHASDSAAVVFPQAPTTSSKYSITVGTTLAATDILTTTALLDCAARHELMETEKFGGGLLRAFMHAGQHRDLWDDTTFKNSAIYDNSGRFKNYRLGRWFDIEFLVSSEVYREDADGTENQADGVVHVMPVFGANSYAVYSFANPGGSGQFGVKFYIVDQPDSQNLRNSANYLSWKGMFARGVLRATSVIDLMTGATDLGITV